MQVIETERLILRKYRITDSDAAYELFSDEETMAYYPAPFDARQTRIWIDRNIERYEHDGFGLWAVCLKESGEFIGDCGLVKQTVDGAVEVEIGYPIHKRNWSRGFASEAAAACQAYGFQRLGLN